MQLTITLPLKPVPASRPVVPRRGKPYYRPTYAAWREAAAALMPAPGPGGVPTGPLAAHIDVVCQRPQRITNPIPRGDPDNYGKAALDAVTSAGLWGDDVQVVDMRVRKRYARVGEQPRTTIRFIELGEDYANWD